MRYEIEYAGVKASAYNVYPTNRPNIPAPERDIEDVEIPGVDGAYHIDHKRYKPITIKTEFNYYGKPEEWAAKWRVIKKWLSKQDGKLIFSDDQNYFYQVKKVKIGENERTGKKIGTFTVEFECDPYLYVNGSDELQEITLTDGKAEIYSEHDISKPVYVIIGNGDCTLKVNGNSMTVSITRSIEIDTEREIVRNSYGENASTCVSGSYEGLHLIPGTNTIELTGSGFTLQIAPKWRDV